MHCLVVSSEPPAGPVLARQCLQLYRHRLVISKAIRRGFASRFPRAAGERRGKRRATPRERNCCQGCCQGPEKRGFRNEKPNRIKMPGEGFEPPAYGLQNRCTTAVLTRPETLLRPHLPAWNRQSRRRVGRMTGVSSLRQGNVHPGIPRLIDRVAPERRRPLEPMQGHYDASTDHLPPPGGPSAQRLADRGPARRTPSAASRPAGTSSSPRPKRQRRRRRPPMPRQGCRASFPWWPG